MPPEVVQAYTPTEVAALMRCSVWWVQEQARRGRVPCLRTSRGRVSFLPHHIAALQALAEVAAGKSRPLPARTLAALGATDRSRAAHRRTA